MDIVRIDNLTFKYDNNLVFNKFSLSIKEGSFTSITGSNGSGKSTLLKIISGIIKTNSNILVCDSDINNYDTRKKIGIIFENIDNMFLYETIEDDFIFILENMCFDKLEIKNRIENISKEFNIKHLLNKNSFELSGGEKVRVALAMALIHNPRILILDESLSMIDEIDRNTILNILKQKNKEGLTIINVIHDLRESYFSDRLIVMNNGQIMLDGNPIKVMEKDKYLNRLGISIPFEVDLSIKLKLYGLIDEIVLDLNKLVDLLWE